MRSGTTARAFVLDRVVPPLKGLNKYIDYYYPGLAPWAVQEYRPYRAHLRFYRQSVTCLFGCGSLVEEPRATVLKFRRITSAVGTILFIAQGGESAKGTNRTLGIHKQQII